MTIIMTSNQLVGESQNGLAFNLEMQKAEQNLN